MEISFAYQSFKWESEARGRAQVTVIIIGLTRNDDRKRLFHYDDNGNLIEINPECISPYLIETSKTLPIVMETSKPLNGFQKMKMGSKPIDGGNYIFTSDEKEKFLAEEPNAKDFFRPYVNADEFLNGNMRSILALHNIEPHELRRLPRVMKRVNLVRLFRKKSIDKGTKKLADNPTSYHLNVIPTSTFLIIPRVTSEKREYVPIGFLEPPIIPSSATMVIENASLDMFGLLTSKMHMIWLRTVGGKLKFDLRYSKGIVYNTFPIPTDWSEKSKTLWPYAQSILDARKSHPESTLADLYDPTAMPTDLKNAHQKLDKAVEKLYRKKPFESDSKRQEFLLEEYQKMIDDHQTTL